MKHDLRPLLLLALLLPLSACSEHDSRPKAEPYPLRGLHRPLSCASCHESADLSQRPPRDCGGCHLQDRPTNHEPFPCEQCHTEDGWGLAAIDHGFFPLEDGHFGPACVDCHPSGYEDTSPICASCHEQDRPAEHVDGGCESCHDIRDWGDAEFEHSSFPLTWGHSDLACDACHDGAYANASSICSSCHAQDKPDGHLNGACDTCHDTHDWANGSFNHAPFFPVPHEGISACESCHVLNDGYQSFSCIDCHSHDETSMYIRHIGRAGYAWESEACLDCHPWGDD